MVMKRLDQRIRIPRIPGTPYLILEGILKDK